MRTLNARAMTDVESEWIADVKRVYCVFCDQTNICEAHHPTGCQGLHFQAIAACDPCHDGHVWNVCGMTEQEATNETVHRVTLLRNGTPYIPQQSKPIRIRKRGGDLSSKKQLPRQL